MAICNLFKKLTSETGNFLMFSQYTEDLTKMYTQPGQLRVTPSKFIALNIDYKKWWNNRSNYLYSEANTKIPEILQNYFENGCAVVKDYEESLANQNTDDNKIYGWTPEMSKNIFWRTMIDFGLITKTKNTTTNLDCFPEIVYIGDINMQNYNSYDGMGYNEIYCHIPSDGKKIIFNSGEKIESDQDPVVVNDNFIRGYREQITGALNMALNETTIYLYSQEYDSLSTLDADYVEETDDKSFNFNTLILLYDLRTNNYDETEADLEYSNIPMGIYFSGIVDESGEMTNSTTKYVTNTDTYGAGTSYGVRICNRFITDERSDYYVPSLAIEFGDEDFQINNTEVLSQMADTLAKLNDVIDKQHADLQLVKDMLQQVRNSQTNVPYIKEINGYNHWFVNGKYLGVKEAVCSPYDKEEVADLMDKFKNDDEDLENY